MATCSQIYPDLKHENASKKPSTTNDSVVVFAGIYLFIQTQLVLILPPAAFRQTLFLCVHLPGNPVPPCRLKAPLKLMAGHNKHNCSSRCRLAGWGRRTASSATPHPQRQTWYKQPWRMRLGGQSFHIPLTVYGVSRCCYTDMDFRMDTEF